MQPPHGPRFVLASQRIQNSSRPFFQPTRQSLASLDWLPCSLYRLRRVFGYGTRIFGFFLVFFFFLYSLLLLTTLARVSGRVYMYSHTGFPLVGVDDYNSDDNNGDRAGRGETVRDNVDGGKGGWGIRRNDKGASSLVCVNNSTRQRDNGSWRVSGIRDRMLFVPVVGANANPWLPYNNTYFSRDFHNVLSWHQETSTCIIAIG